MKTNLVLGPPGTGKTTFLISRIKDYLKVGYNIGQIAFVSFTKAAVTEAINRCYEAFPDISTKEFVYFRTLHSFAFMEANLRRGQILSNNQISNFEEIMGDNGYEVKYNFTEDCYDNVRNIPIYLNHIAENKQKTVEEIYNSGNYDVSLKTIKYVLEGYKKFKDYFKVIDFNDMLKFDFKPLKNVKIVFLDEAQDLTPLQWSVFYKLFGCAEESYIAGDDCQAIYEWCGVDIEKFLSVNYQEKIILDQSYRLPFEIYKLSEVIKGRIKDKFQKDFKPNSAKGVVKLIFDFDEIKGKMSSGSWLILARNNYLLNKVNDWFYESGIPFLYHDQNQIKKDDLNAILNWEAYRKTGEYKESLQSYTDSKDKKKTWFEAFIHMEIDLSNYYRDILRNGFKLTEKPKTEITTIHRAKGREADNVILLTDFSKSCSNLIDRGDDSEHRVFYVGVTRAKENLYLLEPYTNNYYEV